MSDFLDRIATLSPKRLALLAAELHEQVEAAHEPIAVIGVGCRFPGGADDTERYWALLRDGVDATREVPRDRWDIDAFYDADPDAPAKMSTRRGGFLDRIDGFDPAFFGIAPREALTMDPQQRLLLEVAWEALENAGLPQERLAGSATGVFLGICNGDHFQRVLDRGTEAIDAYLASGNAHSVAAGRISYFLGLHGPALSIDTACSSSLVALHLACGSLRKGEVRVALAAGVNVMCTPETTIALSKAHMLAPDGRCKTFSADADGFARGEGCGVVVLKRLSDAIADDDPIVALIRGTAVNQDGRSSGLTVPNGPAQEAVIRAALADAGVSPADIGYVEAHGTGTTLGDPIEVRALAGALGAGRPADEPLLVGSVKTNMGHLESAAGIAGLIKVILSLQHERIPPHLHFTAPSPHIQWAEYPVKVAAVGQAWPRGARRRLAGVSSFGFSGTNAHAIVEEAPALIEAASSDAAPPGLASLDAPPSRPLHCLPLSARSETALRAIAGRWSDVLASPDAPSLGDACHTAGAGRSHFGERIAVVAANAADAQRALRVFANGDADPAVHRGTAAPGATPEVVFLFTGQGAQYPGMSAALYGTSPVFREVIDTCDALLGADNAGRTLKAVLFEKQTDSADNAHVIHETRWTQPALFAVEYGLAQLWRSWGIEPAAVIGHSAGEYVAACVAGVFTLEEGIRLIAERGRLMQALPPGGAMAALFAPVAEIAAEIASMADRVAIAAINAPDSVVISGDADAVDVLLARLALRNVEGHRLFVSLAGHSPLVEPALDAMEACARAVTMRAPRIPVAWNLTGGALPTGIAPDAMYWRRQLREAVRFADGIATLHRDGYRVFLEVGPHPTLIALAQRSLPEGESLFLTSLRRGKDDWQELLASLAELYVRGAPVDWAGVDRPYGFRRRELPNYAFDRRSFWIASPRPGARGRVVPAAPGTSLLGERLPTADPVFEQLLTPAAPAWLGDHRINGAVIVAAPVFLEMAQAAARASLGARARAVEAFTIHEALLLPEEGRVVQLQLSEQETGATRFRIHSRATDGADGWQLHVTGRLVDVVAGAPSADGDVSAAAVAEREQALGAGTDATGYYERLEALGIRLGDSYRALRPLRRRPGDALGTIARPGAGAADAVTWAHPSLLDATFQLIGAAVPESTNADDVFLLTEIERIEITGSLPATFTALVSLRDASVPSPAQWTADITLHAGDGAALGVIRGVRLKRATRAALARAAGAAVTSGLYYRVAWEPVTAAAGASTALAAPEEFVPAIRASFRSAAKRNRLSVYETLLPELDRLAAGHIAVALDELAFDATVGRSFLAETEARTLGIAPRHRRLFSRLLGILAEDGVLALRGERFEVMRRLPREDVAARYGALIERFQDGGADGELTTLRRCGGELARVLRGERDPLELLFPGGSFAESRKLYVESPYARSYNGALSDALRAAIAAVPGDRRVRILEVGAGTGGTTSYVLPVLPADRVEYTFTDLSPLFLERASAQFAAQYPFLRTGMLDLERDPLAQGFEAAAFDIVIAANVVHATADLRQALEHVRRLLAPGGLLFLLEGVAPERWVDLTFGLTEGWWRFTDTALRPQYSLIDRQQWLATLAAAGFTGAAAVPEREDAETRAEAQHALIVARAPAVARHWTVLADEGGVASALASRMVARGDTVAQFPVSASPTDLPDADAIVYLGALDLVTSAAADPAAPDRTRLLACETPLRWLGEITRRPAAGRAWLFTRGAQAANDVVLDNGHWQAPLWGIARVFALESPARWGGIVDLPLDGTPDAIADAVLAALDARDAEDQTAWRGAARFAARIAPAPAPPARPLQLHPDATYLVTGGFGGLGLIVARWMAERGARRIALLGRHPDATAEAIGAIEAIGARVIPLAGDVADETAMRRVLRELSDEAAPLRGIVHAAADFSVAPVGEITGAQVAAVLRPKLDGAALLERLTAGMELDFFVLFSSTTALLGAGGFAVYAAANAFLDGFARSMNRRGRHVLSVNWGTWEAMRLATEQSQRSYRESGLLPMPADATLDALGRLLGGDAPEAVVASVDWRSLKALHEARRPRPFLSRVSGGAEPPRALAQKGAAPGLAERLARAPGAMRGELIAGFVRTEVAGVLGLDPLQPISTETGLFEMGMDSLMSVELKRRLEKGAGRPLPSTLTFNYPNIAALAAYLEREFAAATTEQAPVREAPVRTAAAPELSRDLAALSDAELEARLLARLEQSR